MKRRSLTPAIDDLGQLLLGAIRSEQISAFLILYNITGCRKSPF